MCACVCLSQRATSSVISQVISTLSLDFFLKNYFYTMHMSVFLACVAVYHRCAWCSQKLEEGIGSPGNRVIDCCELPCGFLDSNSGSLEE